MVTLSYVFGNAVKILAGQKFDISFLLEIPFSSNETNFSIIWKSVF